MSLEPRILLPSEWELVAPIVTGVFKDAMPVSELQATFPALMDGDKLAGFVHVETLFHFASIYTAPEYRRLGLERRLVEEAVGRVPKGFSAVVLTKKPAIVRLALSMGATDRGDWKYLRRDF